MPVYTEVAFSQRELRVQPTYAQPLPDLSNKPLTDGKHDEYDVIVVGAGPSGLLATLLLARYGIPDSRLLCIDSKPGTLRSGQADGLQPRTEEVIESLGLHHEIIDQGCQMWEISFWNPDGATGIKRTSYGPDVDVPSTYPHETTIHQGRIERIFDDDLRRYSPRGIERNATLNSLRIDESGNSEYPVLIEIEKGEDFHSGSSLAQGHHQLRCKYLIGADGAHSTVRRHAGLLLEGESREYIWGVMDFIADTKFPDIRRKSMVQSAAGSCMIIPRERVSNGDHLTRIYVHMDETESEEMQTDKASGEDARSKAKEKRGRVTVERILGQADQVLQPYGIRMKPDTGPDWWAAYEIGQRMCKDFIKRDSRGVPRVFLVGDACHTHSPKAGQGMNVSMMDSYNLAWKLAHHLQAITPDAQSLAILESYEQERRNVARELIEYDRALSTAFSKTQDSSSSCSTTKGPGGLTDEQLNAVWRLGHGFTSGCGIEYGESGLVNQAGAAQVVSGDRFLHGILRPGRRLLNVRIQRHADGRPSTIHEELPSVGRFAVILLASTDLLDLSPAGRSARAVASLARLVAVYGRDLLHAVVLHPLAADIRGVDWDALPPALHELAETSFYAAHPGRSPRGKGDERVWGTCKRSDDVYATYGVDRDEGAFVVVRPDQVVASVVGLAEEDKVEIFLDRWLRRRDVAF